MDYLFGDETINARKMILDDKYIMVKWLSDPKVLQYYEGRDSVFTLENIEQKYFSDRNVSSCLIIYLGMAVGYLQFYKIENEMFEEYEYDNTRAIVYGIDLFIGETEYWNKSIGRKILSACLQYLFRNRNAQYVIIDPHVDNLRAIHVYEKVGFRKVKVIKEHELHEGKMCDCWLMEADKLN